MEIVWLGHSCFRLRAREAAIVTDPCPKSIGYNIGRPAADIVTVSHEHTGHNAVEAVAGSPRVVRGPGEYEIAGVLITGIRTYHDNQKGAEQGPNTAFIVEAENLRLCHLGDLGHQPTPEQVEVIGAVDVLLVPVGGGNTLGAAAAAETVSLLEPKLVIPMHYATPATTRKLDPLDRFLKEAGASPTLTPQPRLSVSHSALPHETQIAVLDSKR